MSDALQMPSSSRGHGKRGRPAKNKTEAERNEANRKSSLAYYHRSKYVLSTIYLNLLVNSNKNLQDTNIWQ